MFFCCAHCYVWGIRRVSGCEKCNTILPFHRWVFPCHLLDLLPLPLLLLIFFLRNQQAFRFSVELFAKLGINKLQQKHQNSAKPPKAIGTLPAASCWKMALLRYAHPSAPPNLWRENPLLHPQQSIHPPFILKKKGNLRVHHCMCQGSRSIHLAFSTIMMGYMIHVLFWMHVTSSAALQSLNEKYLVTRNRLKLVAAKGADSSSHVSGPMTSGSYNLIW